MSIVITGGVGFIGSNLVHALNRRGRTDLVVVDDLSDASKAANLTGATIADYIDKDQFRAFLGRPARRLDDVTAVLHQGACSRTDEPDGRFVLDNNYEYSRELLEFCRARRIPLIYASSAAVYGRSASMSESPDNEQALNAYAWSKLLFDQHVRRLLPTWPAQLVGLRYFNVYGPREQHKGSMASMVHQIDRALEAGHDAVLFGPSHGRPAGGHRRDFVHVDDVVDVICWFLDHPDRSGLFNCGTGRSRTFAELAAVVIAVRGAGRIVHREFPASLATTYQPWTEADLGALRGAGYGGEFRDLEAGVAATVTPSPRRIAS